MGALSARTSWRRDRAREAVLDLDDIMPGTEKLFSISVIYVACESDEDIPYLAQLIGEDNLVSGSDYGHHEQFPTLEANSFTNLAGGVDPSRGPGGGG